MGTIKILDEHLINLIAAGEVIERGASVVKELVENSIDAGATSISISLVDSGIKEITVLDNGHGMSDVEMKKAILPHATSKIKDETDLFSIRTLGFRGEALASIVAISNVKIKSATTNGKGFMMGLKAGAITSQAYIGHPRGTEIQVRDLFYNTPARLQNLKSINAELSYITDFVTKIAMANPEISFKLINNNNKIFQSYGNGNLLEVISSAYDVDVAKNMINICADNTLFKISGLISNISVTRASRNNMTIIVNGRVVRNNSILNAIIEGYKTLLTVGRYPICVLSIWVDYSLVDVNVHPTKSEVRFSEEQRLIELIKETISKSLLRNNLIVNNDSKQILKNDPKNDNLNNPFDSITDDCNDDDNYEEDAEEDIYQEDFDNISSQNDLIFEEKSPLFEENLKETLQENKIIDKLVDEKQNANKPFQQSFDFVRNDIIDGVNDQGNNLSNSNLLNSNNSNINNNSNTNNNSNIDNKGIEKLTELHYVGQLFGTYILAQNEDYFYMIDQHAANERINYEKIIEDLKKDNIVKYEILLPPTLHFNPSEYIMILDKMDIIESLGIELQDLGSGTFVVRMVPLWINQKDIKDYVEEIIIQVINEKKSTKEAFLDNLSKSLACKRSIKANEFLSATQISYLLEDLIKCSNPYTCPHGRPIIIKHSKYQVEKWFKRIQ